jgi:hypothetical protein
LFASKCLSVEIARPSPSPRRRQYAKRIAGQYRNSTRIPESNLIVPALDDDELSGGAAAYGSS